VALLRHFDDAADFDDGLALGDQLLGGFELTDDLLRHVPGAFRGEVPGQSARMRTLIRPGTTCGGARHEASSTLQWTTGGCLVTYRFITA